MAVRAKRTPQKAKRRNVGNYKVDIDRTASALWGLSGVRIFSVREVLTGEGSGSDREAEGADAFA